MGYQLGKIVNKAIAYQAIYQGESMDQLQQKVEEAKTKMAELNAKVSSTSNPDELKAYNQQIQALTAELASFLQSNVSAQQKCINNVMEEIKSIEIRKVCFNSTSEDIKAQLEDAIKSYISQNDSNFNDSEQMMQELSSFAGDEKEIQTVLRSKNSDSFKEVKPKNIELGELTEFGNVALPSHDQKLIITFRAQNGDLVQLQTNEKGKPDWVRGLD